MDYIVLFYCFFIGFYMMENSFFFIWVKFNKVIFLDMFYVVMISYFSKGICIFFNGKNIGVVFNEFFFYLIG